MIIGIVGPIAGGKSTVADLLVKLTDGLKIAADPIVHQLLATEEFIKAVRKRFGEEVVTGGTIDRKRLAARIFGDDPAQVDDRHWLEDLLHPRVRQHIVSELEILQSIVPDRWLILDIPLLLEAGYRPLCDRVVYADSPLDVRIARAALRGWTERDLIARQSLQWPLDEKTALATDRVDCSGTLQQLEDQLATMVARWQSENSSTTADRHRRSGKIQ